MTDQIDAFLSDDDKKIDKFLGNTKEKKKRGGVQREAFSFENDIEATCFVYQSLKYAFIQKQEPKAFLGRMKDGKYFVGRSRKSGADFVGGLCHITSTEVDPAMEDCGGSFFIIGNIIQKQNAIFIECKSSVAGQISLWQEDGGIMRHQIEIMEWLEKCGFICLFLWEIRNEKCVFKFTPQQLISGVGGAKKLTMENCLELKFPKVLKVKHGVNFYWDFLGLL